MTTLKTIAGFRNTGEGRDFEAGCAKACAARASFVSAQGPAATQAATATYKGPATP